MSDIGARLDRIHLLGGCLARTAYAAFAGMYLLGCLVAGPPFSPAVWPVLVAAVANAAAISGRRFEVWAITAGSLSALATLLFAIEPGGAAEVAVPSLFAEIGAMLILLVRTAWKMPRRRLVLTALLLGAAILSTPLRWSALAAVLFTAPLGITVAIAAGIGLYLRAMDARRARSLAAARRDERLDLARDLHDFVAHHVTGIVVQAQAARFAARSGAAPPGPDELDDLFGGIEKAGTEALTSMRRMVGLLRDAQHVNAADGDARGAVHRPVGDIARIQELVEGFTHPPAALAIAPDLGTLPPEVAASAHRVVQEALTNVRKHAADAASVRVTLARVGGEVEVAVRDDGRGRGRRLPSGGFGLTGLAERIGALGGRLHAGPRPEGGWEVVAVLPAGDR
ncbi:sensor histidine kinase [Actinomadura sp. 3N508]|uniref:sensor histidine kinase n=1 Tax=Actinomadura sp. 3N508 TaxID=3375153 RepID=UPI0037A3FACF